MSQEISQMMLTTIIMKWFLDLPVGTRVNLEERHLIDLVKKIYSPLQEAKGTRLSRQKEVAEWCTAAFGHSNATRLPMRAMRFLEEAVELFQTIPGVSKKDAQKVLDHVFERKVGGIRNEFGGVGITLLAFAEAAGINADECELQELERVKTKDLSHFARRNEEKNAAGLFIPPTKEE